MSDPKTTDPVPGWKPQHSVCFVFSDETAQRRTSAALQAFIDDVRATANRHGFDLSMQGTEQTFARFFHRHFTEEGTHRE